MVRLEECPVCCGFGGWDKNTGRPEPEPDESAPGWRRDLWLRCLYCLGGPAS